ncbi:MAG: hypothetical protein QXJ75_04465 [Candidatus Bathyarchaeia archaeon]
MDSVAELALRGKPRSVVKLLIAHPLWRGACRATCKAIRSG